MFRIKQTIELKGCQTLVAAQVERKQFIGLNSVLEYIALMTICYKMYVAV